VQDIDLQDMARRDSEFIAMEKVIDSLRELDLFPSLTWVYVWDIIREKYESYSGDPEDWQDVIVPAGITLKNIWDKLFETADDNEFTLEYGLETLHEHVEDWMRNHDFLTVLDEDGWLE
jgi:RNA binding exosome subunit